MGGGSRGSEGRALRMPVAPRRSACMTPTRSANLAAASARLSQLPYRERLAAVRASGVFDDPFVRAAADSLIDRLAPADDSQRSALDEWLAELPDSSAASYVRAIMAGRDADAARHWGEFFQRCPALDPALMAQRARALAGTGDWSGAARYLRHALETR